MSLLALGVVLSSGCSDPDQLSWEIINSKDFPSPDGKYIASTFEECCYCTTGDIPHVYLRRAGQERGTRGNVFVGDLGQAARLTWTSASSLLVQYHQDPKIALSVMVTNLHGVSMTFTNEW